MAKYKINFKDAECQYVEKYYAGEFGTPVDIYYTEGDEITPKKYFATVGIKSVEGADIDEIKKNIDSAVKERDSQLKQVVANDKKYNKKFKKTKDSTFKEEMEKEWEKNLATWGKKEADIWRNTDWKARNFKPLLIPEDSFTKDVKVVGENKILKGVKFILEISPNAIFPPRYVPEEEYGKYRDYAWTYDGRKHNGYSVLDRADTWENYNSMLDSKYSKKKAKDCGIKDADYEEFWNIIYKYEDEDNEHVREFYDYDEALYIYNDKRRDSDIEYVYLQKITAWENGTEYVDELKGYNIRDSKAKDCGFKDSSYQELVKFITKTARDPYGYTADEILTALHKAYPNAKIEDVQDAYDQALNVRWAKSELKNYGFKDCNMATLTPGTVNLKKANKKVNQKDKKFCDASADEIIDLFHEAYIKGRSWDWLKNKLPRTFLNGLYKRDRWGNPSVNLFPIQADRTGHLEGVHLTKPKRLSENYSKQINDFVDALEHYVDVVSHIDAEITPVDTYDYYKVREVLDAKIKETDSKKESIEIEDMKSTLDRAMKEVGYAGDQIRGFSYYRSHMNNWADKLITLGRAGVIKAVIKEVDSGYKSTDYIKEQREPLIRAREGGYIRSDSKVGPLTPEAEAYIRRIMGNTTTEEIEAKKSARRPKGYAINHDYYSRGKLPQYQDEISEMRSLIYRLKEELKKEKRMDIDVTNRKHGYYKYTGKGPYDYNGMYKGGNSSYGGYDWTNETKPTSVRIDIEGLNQLSTALEQILNAGSVDQVEKYLQEALEVVKTLPRNNPKVAEIKAKMKELLEKRRNAPKIKRALPDKKFSKRTK